MGFIAVTNNELAASYYKSVYYNKNIGEILEYVEQIHSDKTLWCKTFENQIDEIMDRYYGYNNISKIMDFSERVSLSAKYITTTKYEKKTYKCWFANLGKTNNYFAQTNDLRNVLANRGNYIITCTNYDAFLAEQIISQMDYFIYVDEGYHNQELIKCLCAKYKKTCHVRYPLKMYCLVSSQRSGSSLFVDYIQKTSKRLLGLSEIFHNYFEHYDVTHKNGCLNGFDVFPLTKTNMTEYVRQFEEIAEYKDYEGVLFKWTLDFLDKNIFSKNKILFDSISYQIRNYNIIHLNRDARDSIESILYQRMTESNNAFLSTKGFEGDHVDVFTKNANYLKNNFLLKFKNVKFIDYMFIREFDFAHNIECINEVLNSFYKTHEEYLVYQAYYKHYNIFNKKRDRKASIVEKLNTV
jgi:hypothetical protein